MSNVISKLRENFNNYNAMLEAFEVSLMKNNALELIEEDFLNLQITDADIVNTSMSKCNFKNCTFEGAYDDDSIIEKLNFIECTFINCTFDISIRNSIFRNCEFVSCKFKEKELYRVAIINNRFDNCNLNISAHLSTIGNNNFKNNSFVKLEDVASTRITGNTFCDSSSTNINKLSINTVRDNNITIRNNKSSL